MSLRHYLRININVRFRQHIKAKREKGASVLGVVFSFVPYFAKRIIRSTIHRNRNLINGRGLYDLPVLVSYPRSGTNWVRFIIESLSGKATPGRVRLHKGKDYAVDRAHSAAKNGHKYKKMILVLRDYRECLIRHNIELWKEYANVERFLKETLITSKPYWYIENIKAFDKFKGEKLLLYYEDLVNSPETSILNLASILEVDQGRAIAFVADIATKSKASVASYHSSHMSLTAGDTSKTTFHADQNLSEQNKKAFDDFYQFYFPELFDTYLIRYDTRPPIKNETTS